MKNIASTQISTSEQIKENRLRMRQKIKLNLVVKDKTDKQDEISTTATLPSNKVQNKTKLGSFNEIIKKEIIVGNFEDSYELQEKLGQGAHATVYKCIEKSTGKAYAVKITKQGDEELLESTKIQFKLLKNINHQNVIKAEAFYTDRVKMTTYLVCQLCTYKELAIYLRNRNSKPLPEDQATLIITQLLQTLQYLHKKGICHRDIKPQNILYDPENRKIKVIDFDCSKSKKQYEAKFQMWTKTGSLHYQAPEYFQQGVYSEKVDIWAAGVIAYQMVTGSIPFKSNYYNRMVKMITQDEIDFEQLQVSTAFKFLLKSMLEKNAEKRLSAEECRRLPVLLKTSESRMIEMLDDFNIDLNTAKLIIQCRLSCTDLGMRRKSQFRSPKKDSLEKEILKFGLFVTHF